MSFDFLVQLGDDLWLTKQWSEKMRIISVCGEVFNASINFQMQSNYKRSPAVTADHCKQILMWLSKFANTLAFATRTNPFKQATHNIR